MWQNRATLVAEKDKIQDLGLPQRCSLSGLENWAQAFTDHNFTQNLKTFHHTFQEFSRTASQKDEGKKRIRLFLKQGIKLSGPD